MYVKFISGPLFVNRLYDRRERIDSLTDAQVYFIASLPNIGREKATAILESYQTPLNALINAEDWSKTVDGLGPVITNKVREVLNTPYKESAEIERA